QLDILKKLRELIVVPPLPRLSQRDRLLGALGLIVRSPRSTRCCLPDQASPTTMSLLRSLTTAPTSTPRRTTLHPRHTAAKLQEWHTDRALKQFRSIWWQEETSSCRTDRRHTQRSRILRHRSNRPCWAE